MFEVLSLYFTKKRSIGTLLGKFVHCNVNDDDVLQVMVTFHEGTTFAVDE